MWVRLYRVRKAITFFQKLEKDIRINYFAARILKLLSVELYCTHTAACIFYYLATTVPASSAGDTWIGSLTLGHHTYVNFREMDLGTRYTIALYWAVVTMATLGYGDIHAVNIREMIFVMIYVSFDMVLGAYLIGNMTALIVKDSNTEKFRDKMTTVIKYSNRHNLGKHIRGQMKNYVRLQFESKFTDEAVTHDFPFAIRAKISQALYRDILEKVYIFNNCSSEFLNQIVTRLHEEYFLPGEVIMEQGAYSDHIYIVSYGLLEEVLISDDGKEEIISKLEPQCVFGEIAVLCNIPQPYMVRVCDLCKVLRLDRQVFTNLMQLCFLDAHQVTVNLAERQASDVHLQKLATDVASTLIKQDFELALRVNVAAFRGDFRELEKLVKAGVDLERTDYDGKSALHLAASKGHQDMVSYLIQKGCNVNRTDNYGNSPLFGAVIGGHDGTISILVAKGALLHLKDSATTLCNAVINGDIDLLRRLLQLGVNPNSTNHNLRTPLHIAAADGLFMIVKLLLGAGANMFSKDRWGHTPFSEAQGCGNSAVMNLFNDALSSSKNNLLSLPDCFPATDILDQTTPLQVQSRLVEIADVNIQRDPAKDAVSCEIPINFQTHIDSERGLTHLSLNQRDIDADQQEDTFKLGSEKESSSCRNNKLKAENSQSRRKCTVFPYHPWTIAQHRKLGAVIWLPATLLELLDLSSKIFGKEFTHVLNEDGGVITSIDLIDHRDKLYVLCDQLANEMGGG